jgi:hypothetical protein
MATFGWKLGSPSDNNNNNVIATTQSVAPSVGGHDPGQSTPVAGTPATQTPLAPLPPATMPTRADGPPVRGDFYSGTANHWVDPTYRTDANGNPLSPEQQAYWRDYDRKRAEAASIARSNNVGGGGTPDPSISGIDYNRKTGQWNYYDTKTKGWQTGKSVADIYNTLFTDKQRSEHPLFYYENMAANQDTSADIERRNNYRQAQSDALAGTPTTRYMPVRF